MQQQQPQLDLGDRWTQHQRRKNKTTPSWACVLCLDRRIFPTADELWHHARTTHRDQLPSREEDLQAFRAEYESKSFRKRPTKPSNPASTSHPEPEPSSQTKRPLSSPTLVASTRSLSELHVQGLALGGTKQDSDDIPMKDISEDNIGDQPRTKRAALGDGISATGSASPIPFRDSESPSPRRSRARPLSSPHESTSDVESRRQNVFEEPQRPRVEKKMLWTPDQDTSLTRASFSLSNVASVQIQKSRNQTNHPKSGKSLQPSAATGSPRQPAPQKLQYAFGSSTPTLFSRAATQGSQTQPKDEAYDIVMQPETRPISQEQLVAEVKGIYAGLVMVEAKCIEVDNKQAILASADPSAQPKLNNEQWQALIALHRTLLHEHHDFFLASQHPSASPALRRLASKYAMPARMWRHGIHSFLELLRHRLPSSLDHMLAFIYLAYSMMALLYETVPAFEDTWIECLGDLGRYRMAIEDDDIRDREVWTGVARHWYSKASDKAPTTGRLYHHLAILARPNALQQLFYYSKSLCVATPFASARESVLTLFDPVLNAENGQGQYRLPSLDTAFVMAHGLLFTNREMARRFDGAFQEFLRLIDNHIGRVTRKFMEQGYHIAVANAVALLGFAAKDNVLMRAISSPTENEDVTMQGTLPDESSLSVKNAERLFDSTVDIVLQRIGDPNVLPFIHVTLLFMYRICRHSGAINIIRAGFPWERLAIMLNALLVSYDLASGSIENDTFPLPEKDDVRPLPEDFALRGLLWAEDYFPADWFHNEKIDEDEKYHERASMTAQRKERILWLAVRIARSAESDLDYDSGRMTGTKPQFSFRSSCVDHLDSGASTFESIASATTSSSSIDRTGMWLPVDESVDDYSSDGEDV